MTIILTALFYVFSALLAAGALGSGARRGAERRLAR